MVLADGAVDTVGGDDDIRIGKPGQVGRDLGGKMQFDAEPAAADATPPVTEADKPAVDSKEVGASALDVSPAIVPDAGATLTPGSLAAALDTMRRAR